jgi:hypothetical protein
MNDAPTEEGLPPSLRFLKGLVILLTLTMIGGVITVVGLLVTRMPHSFGSLPTVPETLQMPQDAKAQAVTYAEGMVMVVTEDGRILVFSPEGRLRQEIALEQSPSP